MLWTCPFKLARTSSFRPERTDKEKAILGSDITSSSLIVNTATGTFSF